MRTSNLIFLCFNSAKASGGICKWLVIDGLFLFSQPIQGRLCHSRYRIKRNLTLLWSHWWVSIEVCELLIWAQRVMLNRINQNWRLLELKLVMHYFWLPIRLNLSILRQKWVKLPFLSVLDCNPLVFLAQISWFAVKIPQRPHTAKSK